MEKKIIMLAGPGQSSKFIYNAIKDEFKIIAVVQAELKFKDKIMMLNRRAKRLGYLVLIGQLLFILGMVRILTFLSRDRVYELRRNLNLVDDDYDQDKLVIVPNVNSNECLKVLNEIKPDIIIVNGTQIISKKILNHINAVFINTHLGITPKYRGIHGGYWALANGDRANCGVTIHLIDPGIDTGSILYQDVIEITEKDNFVTYPYIQLARGIDLMKLALNDLINDRVKLKEKNTKSLLWTHPTLWNYLRIRFTKGVK